MRHARRILLALLLWAAWSASAAAEPWSWSERPRPLYIETCDNAKSDRTRDRICSAFIQASFTQETLPEPALFLRERLIDLIGNYDEAARWAYDWYHNLVAASLVLALVSAGFTWWNGANAERLLVLSAVGAIAIAALSAFGYNKQFKAHFAASRSLTVVKDGIELALIAAAKDKKPIEAATLSSWIKSYETIVAKHVEDFGGSFSPPTSLVIR